MSALSSAVCVSALTAERHRGVAAPINQGAPINPAAAKECCRVGCRAGGDGVEAVCRDGLVPFWPGIWREEGW